MILLNVFYIYLFVKLKVNLTLLKQEIFFYNIIKHRNHLFIGRILETQVEIEMYAIAYEDKYFSKMCFANYPHFR